jgi:hypothetical protein
MCRRSNKNSFSFEESNRSILTPRRSCCNTATNFFNAVIFLIDKHNTTVKSSESNMTNNGTRLKKPQNGLHNDVPTRRGKQTTIEKASAGCSRCTRRSYATHLHKFFACQATFFRSKSKADAFTVDCFQFGASCGSRLFPKTIRHARC